MNTENTNPQPDSESSAKVEANVGGASPDSPRDNQARQEIDSLKDRLARTMAEFQNFRRQSEKRVLDLRKFVIKDVILQVLPIVDSFAAARTAMDQGQNLEQVKEGIRCIHDMLGKFLTDNKVESIPAVGELFNPEHHEVVACEPRSDHEANRILNEIQRGYRVEDIVIRHARVTVAVKPQQS